MVYGDFKHLPTRTASDKLLRGKAFNTSKNPRRDGYQRGLASINFKFFDKKSATYKGTGINSENQQLAEELHKFITKKSKKCKISSSFKDNIWGGDIADML